jgi:hypothetical protein
MGAYRDSMIAAWQKQAGIKPATGEECELLEELSHRAYDLIRVIELEKSGIRDGDGNWYGSDALAGTMRFLVDCWEKYDELVQQEFKSRLSQADNAAKDPEVPPQQLDDPFSDFMAAQE